MSERSLTIDADGNEIEATVSVLPDATTLVLEIGVAEALHIDLEDADTLRDINELRQLLDYAYGEGYRRLNARRSPQQKLSDVRPRGGIYGSPEPVVGLGELGAGQEAAQGSSAL